MTSTPPSIRDNSSTRSLLVKWPHFRAADLAVRVLNDAIVRLAVARDLRQVRDAQHLAGAESCAQLAADDVGDAAADAGVDLVEDECRDGDAPERTTSTARLMRDSSPPEATFASGPNGRPGLSLTWNSTSLEARRVGTLGGLLLELDAESPCGMPSSTRRLVTLDRARPHASRA